MFKRILVLIVFLSLVFWWLSHRNDDKVVTPDTNKEVQTETENTEENETEEIADAEESSESDEEASESSEIEATETEKTESKKTEATEKTETSETEVSTKPVVTTPKPPVVTYRPPVDKYVPIPDVQTNVKVYLYEWNLDMSSKTIPSGTVNFQVQNDGRFTHDFSINGYGNLGKVGPGQSQTFTVKLKPGTYEAFSDRRQDYERGVKEGFTIN